MIVSHKHKFIFLKTRKTGSTSTELYLYPHCGDEDIVTPLTPTAFTKAVGHRAQHHLRRAFRLDPRPEIHKALRLEGFKGVDFHDHIRAEDVRAYVGETVWRSYYKFAFDRNIYDRQVSWFHYRTKKHWKKRKWPDFRSFLETSPEARVDNFHIYTIGGALAVDFIGRYETLDGDLAQVMDALGLAPKTDLPRAKADTRPSDTGYRAYYDEETRRLVESWYPGERALFGHEF
ncbi:MAG: sulfotransferase family 2 domain-containing protein [Parvibaculaceae bacterium]